MNMYFLCKRYYTNKDLINDRFGRLYHLPKQLSEQGHIVFVDTFDYRNRTALSVKENEVLFQTIPVRPVSLLKAIRQVYSHVQTINPDVIFASGDIYIGLIGLILARRLRIKFVYDVYDYYPAFRINRFPGLTSVFNYIVRKSSLVTCASESLQRWVKSRLNQHTLLIQNGVDRNVFTVGDRVDARRKLNLALDTEVVGYFGSINPARGPILIEACRLLIEAKPNLRLAFAGRVEGIDFNDTWIKYYGELPQSSVPDLIHACDVVVVPYAGDQFNSMSGACKIAEYLACGKPVVATRVSDHAEVFKESPASLCEPVAEDMARVLKSQLEHPEIVPYPSNLDWQTIGQTLNNKLTKLVA
ncbi:glycosyltransferase family 4 protein [Methylomonas koyamae]|uniref:glycosyltransferase family 4 protein n=1 Tax=Methylomonas koyamae TaxID=702114 RepID=UPI002872DF99|nr:glycosyltransferase family 4 protein [Methylomonas koyamae]WNB74224.1 glycosyltransferase family 4 protein [Methylomonas koyamae]